MPRRRVWLHDGFDDRSSREKMRPLSVSEAAGLIGVTPQRLAYFIRLGEMPASTLNGKDYVVKRVDLMEFDRNRRHGPGHPTRAELAEREKKRGVREARIERLRLEMERVAGEIAAGKR